MIKIYNTLTGKKEPLKKPRNRTLKLFVCGPTVYDLAHIGNARTYVSFDIIVRYLRSRHLDIFYLQNITDVDDKIIARAKKENKKAEKVAKQFEDAYLKNMESLGVKSVNKYARATDHIEQVVKQVKTLIKKGYVYKIDGEGWYFDLKKFPEYGKLSRRTSEQAEDGISRIDESLKKKNKGDFCVWKFASAESGEFEPKWSSDIGEGRPGWHIEDTAITEHFFGPQYDLHGGGVDLKFPHHEAEIAQQESASGKKPFVKIWMHTGPLNFNGEKMSKSKGNFLTIDELLKKHGADAFRFLNLLNHYRSPINFTEQAIEDSQKNLDKIAAFLARLEIVKKINNKKPESGLKLEKYVEDFNLALEDDLNTPKAMGVLFSLIKAVNPKIWSLGRKQAEKIESFISENMRLFGLKVPTLNIAARIKALADRRELYRRNKQFTQADDLRREIDLLGYAIEDTPKGYLIVPKGS